MDIKQLERIINNYEKKLRRIYLASFDELNLILPTIKDKQYGSKEYKTAIRVIQNKIIKQAGKEYTILTACIKDIANRVREEYELEEIEEFILLTAWAKDGLTIKDRVYRNANTYYSKLLNTVITATEDSNIEEQLKSELTKQIRHTELLTETEAFHTYNDTLIRSLKEKGIEQVQYHSAELATTCETCFNRNGKVYDIDKAPSIPAHCNCYCWYTPLTPKQ